MTISKTAGNYFLFRNVNLWLIIHLSFVTNGFVKSDGASLPHCALACLRYARAPFLREPLNGSSSKKRNAMENEYPEGQFDQEGPRALNEANAAAPLFGRPLQDQDIDMKTSLDEVVSAAVLVTTSFRMRDEQGLLCALRLLSNAVQALEKDPASS